MILKKILVLNVRLFLLFTIIRRSIKKLVNEIFILNYNKLPIPARIQLYVFNNHLLTVL